MIPTTDTPQFAKKAEKPTGFSRFSDQSEAICEGLYEAFKKKRESIKEKLKSKIDSLNSKEIQKQEPIEGSSPTRRRRRMAEGSKSSVNLNEKSKAMEGSNEIDELLFANFGESKGLDQKNNEKPDISEKETTFFMVQGCSGDSFGDHSEQNKGEFRRKSKGIHSSCERENDILRKAQVERGSGLNQGVLKFNEYQRQKETELNESRMKEEATGVHRRRERRHHYLKENIEPLVDDEEPVPRVPPRPIISAQKKEMEKNGNAFKEESERGNHGNWERQQENPVAPFNRCSQKFEKKIGLLSREINREKSDFSGNSKRNSSICPRNPPNASERLGTSSSRQGNLRTSFIYTCSAHGASQIPSNSSVSIKKYSRRYQEINEISMKNTKRLSQVYEEALGSLAKAAELDGNQKNNRKQATTRGSRFKYEEFMRDPNVRALSGRR